MSDSFPDIKSVVARVITNKPVRKTPYQVKGVFMRQYPDEPIIPMLDGSYRDRYLYPRVQVKILNEQIYIIGVHEGVESVLSICEKLKSLDFGNITFEVGDKNFTTTVDTYQYNAYEITIPNDETYRVIMEYTDRLKDRGLLFCIQDSVHILSDEFNMIRNFDCDEN